MKILCIDTSTEACSAALVNGEELLERFEIAPSQHSGLILPMIESLLNEAGMKVSHLDAIGFSSGPGSFTGLRIAAGVVQGIAIGADLPVIPVSTLTTLAQYAYEEKNALNVIAALDARMDEVYWGELRYDRQGKILTKSEELVCSPALVTVPDTGKWFGVGPGWTRYAEKIRIGSVNKNLSWEENVYPRARYTASIALKDFAQGKLVSPELAVPVYLRDNIAKVKEKIPVQHGKN